MSSSSSSAAPTSVHVVRIQRLLKKMKDTDKDERFMAVSDLCAELSSLDEHGAVPARPNPASSTSSAAVPILDASMQHLLSSSLLSLLADASPDVQSASIKALAVLAPRLQLNQLQISVEKIAAEMLGEVENVVVTKNKKGQQMQEDSEDKPASTSRDMYVIGLQTIVESIATMASSTSDPSTIGVGMSQRLLICLIRGLTACSSPASPSSSSSKASSYVSVLSACLDVTRSVLTRFGAAVPELHEPLLQSLLPLLSQSASSASSSASASSASSSDGSSSSQKKVVATLAVLVPVLSDKLFQGFMDSLIVNIASCDAAASLSPTSAVARGSTLEMASRKAQATTMLYTYLQLIGVVSTTAGPRIGPYLPRIVPQLCAFLAMPSSASSPSSSATSNEGAPDDLVLNSLAAFESLLSHSAQALAPFLPRVLQLAEELVRYDPNYRGAAAGGEDDEGMQDADDADMTDTHSRIAAAAAVDDDGFGAGGNVDADDDWGDGGDEEDGDDANDDDEDHMDSSPRIRRAALKLLSAFIRTSRSISSPSSSSGSDATLAHLASVLLSRFDERDRNVRVAVLQGMLDILREGNADGEAQARIGEDGIVDGSSDSMDVSSPSPPPSSSSSLSSLFPQLITSCLHHLSLRSSSLDTRHHLLLILLELCYVPSGSGLRGKLTSVIGVAVATLTGSADAHAAGATNAKYEGKIDAVQLVRAMVETHAPSVWMSTSPSSSSAPISCVPAIIDAFASTLSNTPYIPYRLELLQTLASIVSLLGECFILSRSSSPSSSSAANVISSPAERRGLVGRIYTQLLYPTLQSHEQTQSCKEFTLNGLAQLFHYFNPELLEVQSSDWAKEAISVVLAHRLPNELTRIASLRCLGRMVSAPSQAPAPGPGQGRGQVARVVLSFRTNDSAADRRIVAECVSYLRKDSQLLKLETVHALTALLAACSSSTSSEDVWSASQLSALLSALAAQISDADLLLSNSILHLVSLLVSAFPSLTVLASSALAQTDADVLLTRMVSFLRSPLLQRANIMATIDVVANVMRIIVAASSQGVCVNAHYSFEHVFNVFIAQVNAPSATSNGAATYISNVSQVVGGGMMVHLPAAQSSIVIDRLLAIIRAPSASASSSPSTIQFALLTLGDYGRLSSFSSSHAPLVESSFLSLLSSSSAEPSLEFVRSAAALGWGKATSGNVARFLPGIMSQIQEAASAGQEKQKGKLILIMGALKELMNGLLQMTTTIVNDNASSSSSSPANSVTIFRTFLPTLLPLLFTHSTSADESLRSLVSELVGCLLLIDSVPTFAACATLIQSDDPTARAGGVMALRHSLNLQQQRTAHTISHVNASSSSSSPSSSSSSSSSSVDYLIPNIDSSLLAHYLPRYLDLLADTDLIVRRQSIQSVNALAHSSIQHRLVEWSKVMPVLYANLVKDASLVRTIEFGCFKNTIDDGFPIRKSSYQTLSTLLDSSIFYPGFDPVLFLRHVSSGLSDSDDIIILAYGIIERAGAKYPSAVACIIDDITAVMMDGIKEKLKLAKTVPIANDASSSSSSSAGPSFDVSLSVADRAKDVLRSAVRCFHQLQSMIGIDRCTAFVELYQRVMKTAMMIKMMDEIKNTNQKR